MRTDRKRPCYFSEELRAGRMRQGWGYREDLDLRKLAELVSSKQDLTLKQREAWGNRRMLPTEQDSMQEGDVILLPNLLTEGVWSVAEIVDNEYRYEIDLDLGDYGHIRNARLLNPVRPINPYSEAVSANLRNTMRTPRRLWNIDRLGEDVQRLQAALKADASVDQPESGEERLERTKNALKEHLWSHLERLFHGADFERGPCKKLLELLYEEVEHTAGPKEHGADFICSFSDGLGVAHNVAVQVKMWTDERGDDLSRPIEQIREAYRYYPEITSAALITTLDGLTDGSRRTVEELSEDLGIPVRVVLKDDLLELILRHIPDMTEALDWTTRLSDT